MREAGTNYLSLSARPPVQRNAPRPIKDPRRWVAIHRSLTSEQVLPESHFTSPQAFRFLSFGSHNADFNCFPAEISHPHGKRAPGEAAERESHGVEEVKQQCKRPGDGSKLLSASKDHILWSQQIFHISNVHKPFSSYTMNKHFCAF